MSGPCSYGSSEGEGHWLALGEKKLSLTFFGLVLFHVTSLEVFHVSLRLV